MTSESTKSVCPDCGAELPPQAVLCVACGLNLKTGQKITSQVGAAPAAKPKSAAKASSSPKRGALVATLVAFVVLIAAVGGIVVMSQRSAGTSATPAGPLPEQVAAEWRASLATAMESAVCKSRLLTVKGPRLAAEPVAAALGTCSLLPILAEGLPPQSLVATVAFVGLDSSALPADPLEDTSDRSILRLNVQAGKGMVLFSREFQAEQPAIVDPVPGVPDSEVAEAEANRAAVETLVGEIPSLLVGLALASGKPSAKVLDEMEKWLKDEDASRRRAACLLFAAKPVRPKRVPLKLAELLTTADLEVRYAALAALGAYGGEAADTLPILTALLDDADPKTQSGARLVIASIKAAQVGVDFGPSVAFGDPKTVRKEEKARKVAQKREDDTVAALMAEFEEAAAAQEAAKPKPKPKPKTKPTPKPMPKGSWADVAKVLSALFYALH